MERHCVGWRVKSPSGSKVKVHCPVTDLAEADSIEVLFPGDVSQRLSMKINGHEAVSMQVPRVLQKIKCEKVMRAGGGGDIYLSLYKKTGQPEWPRKEDWPDNRATPP